MAAFGFTIILLNKEADMGKSTIIITADLGHFRAYRVSRTPLGSAKLSLIEGYDSLEGHGKLGDKLSDQAGRFSRKDGLSKSKGYGEPHNIELEMEKRMIKLIARDIDTIIAKGPCDVWYFAAPAEINGRIVEQIRRDVKSRMGKSITVNLTGTKKSDIMGYFE
jgi:hypothetical protein